MAINYDLVARSYWILIKAGYKTIDDVKYPASKDLIINKYAIEDVKKGVINAEQYKELTGVTYPTEEITEAANIVSAVESGIEV